MIDIKSQHNLKYGQQNKCQICGNIKLKPIINLGLQPPCDSLIQLKKKIFLMSYIFH